MADKLHEEIAAVTRDHPCTKAEDLFSAPAKRVIARLIPDFLVKNKVTVTEVMHRAELLDRIEGTGTLMQYVVQQTAIVRARAEDRPVQHIIRELNQLATDLVDKVHQDKRKDLFPQLTANEFEDLAADLADEADGAYIINGALARYLRDALTWNEKALRLVAILELSRPDRPGQEVLLSAIDNVLAEVLMIPAAVIDLIGVRETFGDTVLALVHLFLCVGAEKGQYTGKQVLPCLAWYFSSGVLPQARASVASQIITQLYSLQRLRIDSIEDEMRAFRHITELLMGGIDDTLPREELIPALELRSKRFVTPESLNTCLSNSVLPDQKLDWLFFADGCVVGERNKQVLAQNALRIATADSFKNQFQLSSTPLPRRLQRLADLGTAVRRCEFHEYDCHNLAAIFDTLAFELASHAKLFETMAARRGTPVDKALVLLQLHEANTFTEGRMTEKVRDAVIGYMASPGFLEGYAERVGASPESAATHLAQRVQKIGLSPDDVRELLTAAA